MFERRVGHDGDAQHNLAYAVQGEARTNGNDPSQRLGGVGLDIDNAADLEHLCGVGPLIVAQTHKHPRLQDNRRLARAWFGELHRPLKHAIWSGRKSAHQPHVARDDDQTVESTGGPVGDGSDVGGRASRADNPAHELHTLGDGDGTPLGDTVVHAGAHDEQGACGVAGSPDDGRADRPHGERGIQVQTALQVGIEFAKARILIAELLKHEKGEVSLGEHLLYFRRRPGGAPRGRAQIMRGAGDGIADGKKERVGEFTERRCPAQEPRRQQAQHEQREDRKDKGARVEVGFLDAGSHHAPCRGVVGALPMAGAPTVLCVHVVLEVGLPVLDVLEIDGGAAGDAGERILRHAHVQTRGLAHDLRQPPKK